MLLEEVLHDIKEKDAEQKEFIQAVEEVFGSLEVLDKRHPEYAKNGIYQRIIEPERIIIFRIPWLDDKGEVQVNRGYRVQFNSALGPYKGGLRFHESVNLGIIKFLAFEQIFKNALTGLMMGGAKGGSDFNPKGKSDNEIMRFCQSFMSELYRHIGPHLDIPAGDIGVGAREIGYLFGQYKRLQNEFSGALTGKGINYGGSLVRKEATGYGLIYFMERYLQDYNLSLKDKKIIISGSGNVALYALQKASSMGAKVIAMSDSDGYIYDENGIDFDTIRTIKEIDRKRIKEYTNTVNSAFYHPVTKDIWKIKCDIALPCATQNEIDADGAKALLANGVIAVGEGANMPCNKEAVSIFMENGILYAPGKASNAGGVAVSGLEMSQDAIFKPSSFDEVDSQLKKIMENIYENIKVRAQEYGKDGDLLAGANIEGFIKVADAMLAQGIV